MKQYQWVLGIWEVSADRSEAAGQVTDDGSAVFASAEHD